MLNTILRTSEAITSTQAVALRDVRKVGRATMLWLNGAVVNEHG